MTTEIRTPIYRFPKPAKITSTPSPFARQRREFIRRHGQQLSVADRGEHDLDKRVRPLRTIDIDSCQASPASLPAECPDCGKSFVASAVVQDPPFYAESHGTYARMRKLFCDHCDQVLAGLFPTDARGNVIGPMLGLCRTKSPKAIDAFLKAHPQAAGVTQV